jgi:acyl carrier protein
VGQEQIRELARRAAIEVLELEPGELRDDADFHAELGGDSLQQLELVTMLEKQLGVRFRLNHAAEINSVDDAVRIGASYVGT